MKKLITILLLCISTVVFPGNPKLINLHLPNSHTSNGEITQQQVMLIGGGCFILAGVLNMALNDYGHNPTPKGILNQPLFNKNQPDSDKYILAHFLPIISGVALIGFSIYF